MVPWWNSPAQTARLLQWNWQMQHGQLHHHFSKTIATYHNYHHQCDQDPSKVILESVRRIFHGNYSCQVSMLPSPSCPSSSLDNQYCYCFFSPSISLQGKNRAGWGAVSNTGKTLFWKKYFCIFENWHGCRFLKFYPSIISLQNLSLIFSFLSWAKGVLPTCHSSTWRLEGFLLIIFIIILFFTIIIHHHHHRRHHHHYIMRKIAYINISIIL